MMIKLDSVSALELFATTSSETHPNDSEDEVDSDYLGEDDDDSTFSAEAEAEAEAEADEAEEYFLDSDDYRNYGDPSDSYFPINDSLTVTTVLKLMPLGVI